MSELKYLPACSGIYFAIEEPNQVAYIGQSVNIRQRWRAHEVAGDLCELSDLCSARGVRIAWLSVSDVQDLKPLERALIRLFRPRLNANHISKPQPRPSSQADMITPEMRKKTMLSPRQYAAEIGAPYPTVMTWLQRGQLPGARKIETPAGHVWAIPQGTPRPEMKPGPKMKRGPRPGKQKKAAK
jgi:hypothetical protein